LRDHSSRSGIHLCDHILIGHMLPMPIKQEPLRQFVPYHLSRLPRHTLVRGPLRSHFRLNPSRLSPCCSRRTLRLLHLLLALCCRFLLLAFFDGGLTSCGTSFWALGSTLFDDIEGGTDNAPLLLYSTAGAFFGDFLKRAYS